MKKNSWVSLPCSPVLLILCMAISAIASPDSARAQEWRFEPVIRIGGEFDDNATLNIRTDQELELSGVLLELKANIYYSSPTTSFVAQPKVLSRNYNENSSVDLGETDYDSTDFFLRLTFSRRGQTSTIGFRSVFDQQEIRTAERAIADLEIEDPDEITDDDTGRILLSGRRSKWQLAPYWIYQLSDISSIGVAVDYFDVRYEDVFARFLSDYTDARLKLNYRRKFSNANTALLTVTARRTDSLDTDFDVTGYGLMAGFEYALSEKTRVRAMIGFEDVQRSNVNADPEIVGYIGLTRNLETIRLFAQYRRSIIASGAGIAVRDSLNFNFRRRLSEKISAGLGIRAYQSRGAVGLTAIDDRDYIQLQSSFFWYFSTSTVIEVDYRYTVNNRSSTVGERANSNQINLWFTYQPKTIPKI